MIGHILHISSIDPSPDSGMGRISYEWKLAFERKNIQFEHFGRNHIKSFEFYPFKFSFQAYLYVKRMKNKPDCILVHEPCAMFLRFLDIPYIIFSHGIEEREWNRNKQYHYLNRTWRSYLMPQALRFLPNNMGLSCAKQIFICNNEDRSYLIKKGVHYNRVSYFINGYYPMTILQSEPRNIGILFNGSWISRKGVSYFSEACRYIASKYSFRLRIAGFGVDEEIIKSEMLLLKGHLLDLVKHFSLEEECRIYEGMNLFVQASYFEGQSLALIQAMANGLCPIVSDNSGQVDLVKHMHNGLVFKTGDMMSLVEQLVFCFENPDIIKKLSINAQQSVSSRTWNEVGDKFVDLVLHSMSQ